MKRVESRIKDQILYDKHFRKMIDKFSDQEVKILLAANSKNNEKNENENENYFVGIEPKIAIEQEENNFLNSKSREKRSSPHSSVFESPKTPKTSNSDENLRKNGQTNEILNENSGSSEVMDVINRMLANPIMKGFFSSS